MRKTLLVLTLLSIVNCSVHADAGAPMSDVEKLREQGYVVRSITPVFGQLVMFSFPKGFKPAFENVNGPQYMQEWVPEGETVKKWTEMITLTGAKDLSGNPNATPQLLANRIAGGFKKDCPESFNAIGLGAIKLSGHDAFAAILSCGIALPTGSPYSESMLLIVIKGEKDFYTIQWAERGEASSTPMKLDDAKWATRLNKLSPIKLCPIVPGEAPPYPSCIAQK